MAKVVVRYKRKGYECLRHSGPCECKDVGREKLPEKEKQSF